MLLWPRKSHYLWIRVAKKDPWWPVTNTHGSKCRYLLVHGFSSIYDSLWVLIEMFHLLQNKLSNHLLFYLKDEKYISVEPNLFNCGFDGLVHTSKITMIIKCIRNVIMNGVGNSVWRWRERTVLTTCPSWYLWWLVIIIVSETMCFMFCNFNLWSCSHQLNSSGFWFTEAYESMWIIVIRFLGSQLHMSVLRYWHWLQCADNSDFLYCLLCH